MGSFLFSYETNILNTRQKCKKKRADFYMIRLSRNGRNLNKIWRLVTNETFRKEIL